MKDVCNKFVYAGNLLGNDNGASRILGSFEVAIDDLLEFRDEQLNGQEYETLSNLGYWLVGEIRRFLYSPKSREYCFATKTPPRKLFAGKNEPLRKNEVVTALTDAFSALASEKITLLMSKARQYEDGLAGNVFHVGENSKTATSGTTRTTSQNTTGANGTARQKFTNGTATSSSGVSNESETTESGTSNGTTTGSSSATNESPRRYDGDMGEWAKSIKNYRPVFASLRNSIAALFIHVDNVDPLEIISFGDVLDD